MEILDDRAGARAMLVTSQLPVEHWHAWIGGPAMADAMLDRILPQVHRIVLKGESLRAPRWQFASRLIERVICRPLDPGTEAENPFTYNPIRA